MPRDALRGKPYSQIMWFEPDDCSRVAINVVSFAINSVLHPSIVATNSVEKSRCLQFEPIMIAVRYSYGGLTGSPDESGQKRREKGLARAGNIRVRNGLIQFAWRFLKFQPDSELADGSGNAQLAGQ